VTGNMGLVAYAGVQLLTVGMAVWLMQHQGAYVPPTPADPPRSSGQIAKNLMAAVSAVGIWFIFHSNSKDPLIGTGPDLRVILLSSPLWAAVIWVGDTSHLRWLRRLETAGCTSVIALALFRRIVPFFIRFAAAVDLTPSLRVSQRRRDLWS
jgi:hypothetical protein